MGDSLGATLRISETTSEALTGAAVTAGVGVVASTAVKGVVSGAKVASKFENAADTGSLAKVASKTDDVASAAKVGILDNSPQVLKIPQGLTLVEFDKMSSYLLENVGHISSDIRIQGSRAAGTAKVTSDIDIAIMVDPSEFSNIIKHRFKTPNLNSAKERTMKHAVETGKIQSGEAGLRGVRKQLERDIGLEVDISIIKKDGAFDNPPYIQINK